VVKNRTLKERQGGKGEAKAVKASEEDKIPAQWGESTETRGVS